MSKGVSELSNIINDKIDKKISDHIFGQPFPAKILKYDYKTRKADVQCLIKIADGEGDFLDNPVIPNVPVVCYSTKKATISLPIQIDDEGIVIFTNIGIENWCLNGGEQKEHILTKGGLQNCFFIPSIFSENETSEADNGEDLIIKLGNGTIRITKNGEIEIDGIKARLKSTTKGQIKFNQLNILKNISDQFLAITQSLNAVVLALTATSTITVIDPVSGANPISPASAKAISDANQIVQQSVAQTVVLKTLFDQSYEI